MKHPHIIAVLVILLAGCSQNQQQVDANRIKIDSLTAQLQDIKEKYKPGLGEVMLGVQTHHAKLYYAGINGNWPLADYEIGEIKELVEAAKETGRPETRTIDMIEPGLTGVTKAIEQMDIATFKTSFQVLTNTCNNCHTINKFEFNVITVPTALPVTNQDFMTHQTIKK